MVDILLDEEQHIYHVNGQVTKSVTQVLAEEGLTKYWNVDEWYMERGTAVHKAAHLFDLNILDWDSIDPRIEGFLTAYAQYKQDTGMVWEFSEKRLYHPVYDYCGTPDRFLPLYDIKCGQGFPLQLEGYAELLRANEINPGREGFFLELKENGKYNLKPYKFNRTDRGIWLSAVSLNQYKRRQNGN